MISMDDLYRDPYRILGLGPGAAEKEIHRAYRRSAMRYHPDRNPDDPVAAEKFRQVQWAYETLIGKKKEAFTPGKPGQYGSPFPGDTHPFIGFFWAMRAYCNRFRRDKTDP